MHNPLCYVVGKAEAYRLSIRVCPHCGDETIRRHCSWSANPPCRWWRCPGVNCGAFGDLLKYVAPAPPPEPPAAPFDQEAA